MPNLHQCEGKMKHFFDVVARVFFIIIMLINAVIPSAEVLAKPQPNLPETREKVELGERVLTEQAALYYQPPVTADIIQPAKTEPGPKQPPIQPKLPLEFSMSVQPGVVTLNQNLTISITIQNNSLKTYTNLRFKDNLRPGLEYVPDSKSPVTYDASKAEASYTIASLGAWAVINFSYTLKITSKKFASTKGELRIHTSELSTDQTGSMKTPLKRIWKLSKRMEAGISLARLKFISLKTP
jgi:uncharacterized repeat protein (TIGR01451 family)